MHSKSVLANATQLVLVNEWRTSVRCAACHWKLQDRVRKAWRLKRCNNPGCHRTFWHRNVNAAINIEQRVRWTITDFKDGDRASSRWGTRVEELYKQVGTELVWQHHRLAVTVGLHLCVCVSQNLEPPRQASPSIKL